MQISPVITFLVSCLLSCLTTAMPMADIGDYPMQMQFDSYSVVPQLSGNPSDSSGLNLELVPPSAILASSGPRMYYMNSDGIAEPVEAQRRILRKREALPADDLLTDETVIIGPPSGNRPFGVPAVNLGFRPARAYYARRYHKYPWNYH